MPDHHNRPADYFLERNPKEKEVSKMKDGDKERSYRHISSAAQRSTNGWTAWKKGMVLGILILGFLGLSQVAQAQEYPTQPITMLISNAPGAGTDVCSRVMAQGASKVLNQEIIPMNKPGAGGAVAAGCIDQLKTGRLYDFGSNHQSLTVVPQYGTSLVRSPQGCRPHYPLRNLPSGHHCSGG